MLGKHNDAASAEDSEQRGVFGNGGKGGPAALCDLWMVESYQPPSGGSEGRVNYVIFDKKKLIRDDSWSTVSSPD